MLALYNNQQIKTVEENGSRYWSAQSMAEACGSNKRIKSWTNLSSSKEYIRALQKYSKDKKNDLTFTRKGNQSDDSQGTYIHEELVVAFARWLSPDFSVWCDQQIRHLLTEGYAVNPNASEKQLMRAELKIKNQANKIRLLDGRTRKDGYEIEAHAAFSLLYHYVSGRNFTAEYIFKGHRFDFLEKRTDCVIITELKAKPVGLVEVKHELENKGYLQLLQTLQQTDYCQKNNRTVRFKLLAPRFNEDDKIETYLREIYESTDLRFSFTDWDSEYLNLYYKHESKYYDLTNTQRMFAPVKAKLDNIKGLRNVDIG